MDAIRTTLAYDNLAAARELFDEYTQTSGVIETCYKSFEAERDTLPGPYAQPDGRLYLAYVGAELAGCIGMRRVDAKRCEMKRLFVRKEFRGRNIGPSGNQVHGQHDIFSFCRIRFPTSHPL